MNNIIHIIPLYDFYYTALLIIKGNIETILSMPLWHFVLMETIHFYIGIIRFRFHARCKFEFIYFLRLGTNKHNLYTCNFCVSWPKYIYILYACAVVPIALNTTTIILELFLNVYFISDLHNFYSFICLSSWICFIKIFTNRYIYMY